MPVEQGKLSCRFGWRQAVKAEDSSAELRISMAEWCGALANRWRRNSTAKRLLLSLRRILFRPELWPLFE